MIKDTNVLQAEALIAESVVVDAARALAKYAPDSDDLYVNDQLVKTLKTAVKALTDAEESLAKRMA